MSARVLALLLVAFLAAPVWAQDATTTTSPAPEASGQPPYRNSPDPAPPCCPPPSEPAAMEACRANATSEAGRWDCWSDYCATHADAHCAYYCWKYADPACPDPEPRTGNATAPRAPPERPARPDGRPGNATGGHDEADADARRAEERRKACERRPAMCAAEEGNATVAPEPADASGVEARSGRFVAYGLDAGAALIADLRVDGLLAATELRIAGATDVVARDDGEVLRLRADDVKLELHDQPGGLVRFQGDNASLILRVPDDAKVAPEERGALVVYSNGQRAVLRYDNGTWDAQTLVADGFASFHVAKAESRRGDPEVKAEVQQAVEKRKVAAEILVTRGATEAAGLRAADADVQVDAYDEMSVEVHVPELPDGVVRVVLDSNLTEGRTVVLNVDPTVLATTDPARLVLRYYDLNDDGSETEVVFHKASSLADILDAADDGGQPEYYVVSDEQGLQVMVSVPHWSAHAVTMSSLAELAQPRVLTGLLIGLGGVVLAAVALFWPRRE